MSFARADAVMLVVSGDDLQLLVVSEGQMNYYELTTSSAAALMSDAARICAGQILPRSKILGASHANRPKDDQGI
jgi:hypothetical protein